MPSHIFSIENLVSDIFSYKSYCMENDTLKPRLRPVERHCPRCNELLVLNEKEERIECLNCGYIDCGDDD